MARISVRFAFAQAFGRGEDYPPTMLLERLQRTDANGCNNRQHLSRLQPSRLNGQLRGNDLDAE